MLLYKAMDFLIGLVKPRSSEDVGPSTGMRIEDLQVGCCLPRQRRKGKADTTNRDLYWQYLSASR